MSLVFDAVIFFAGAIAGMINVIAGAGTLVTFPVLLALGVPAVTANVSNTVGLVPGSLAGAFTFRRELSGHWPTIAKMAAFSTLGGLLGGVLLLSLPARSFQWVVPFLLVTAAILTTLQPRVARLVRRSSTELDHAQPLGPTLALGITATGVYGGYFGAAQGVVLLALLGIFWTGDFHNANGAKNVLAGTANLVSGLIFVFSGRVNWQIAVLIGFGSLLGGWLGGRVGRRLPASVLRLVVAAVAFLAAIVLLVRLIAPGG